VDFVPIVLGNGNIRLEVKPRVSFLDNTLSVTTQGITVPGLNVREVDTGVEMKSGQTLAIAGLVQDRKEYSKTGIPYLADLPYFGALFRKVKETNNEIELVVMVTPELVDPLDPCDVPPCGPGMASRSPTDCEMYWKGYSEVPSCGPCATGDCLWGGGGVGGPIGVGPESIPTPAPASNGAAPTEPGGSSGKSGYNGPRSSPATGSIPLEPSQRVIVGPPSQYNRSKPQSSRPNAAASREAAEPNLIGPVGYDVVK
jgi:pilus assembly protein CpaC